MWLPALVVHGGVCCKDAEACFPLCRLSISNKWLHLPKAWFLPHPVGAVAPASRNARWSRGWRRERLAVHDRVLEGSSRAFPFNSFFL